MTLSMKIRKGDVVHVLSGKDRGKEGRVMDALPKQRKVIVENLNTVKRHTRPRPLKDSSRMGGPQVAPVGSGYDRSLRPSAACFSPDSRTICAGGDR